ncbi:hypothetical protein PSHT_07071 [Puccinia striiformis]|uniref:PCI domain-containing protein n=1 Tax=Puccinia striiformis TaxID=27350 RepID=A0A2S4W0W3_9BASI|nr:hypothetical protein PSHT_07071 [Puccinia striiformis]
MAELNLTFDLINRVSQYTGLPHMWLIIILNPADILSSRQAINRYRFLAQSSPQISLSAYELALEKIVHSTWDIQLYKDTLLAYNKIAAHNNLPLENDLKNNTISCTKDGIRLPRAGSPLPKSRRPIRTHIERSLRPENTPTALHAAQLSLASLDLALDAENFKLAQSHAAKAQGAIDTLVGSMELKAAKNKAAGSSTHHSAESQDPTEKDIQQWTDRVNVVNALTSLAQGDFARATTYFLKLGREAGEDSGRELLATTSDIGIYTTLCALAHFDRQQLKERLIDNLEFRSVLDSEPQLRQLLNLFRENKYREVFEYLHTSLPIYRTDLYLAEQTNRLMSMIQERAISQYFGSFSSARMNKASEVFGWNMEELEARLVESIRTGNLSAKIDLANLILNQHKPPARDKLLSSVLESAQKIQSQSNAALFRLKLISADLVVRDNNPSNHSNVLQASTPSSSSEHVDRSK